MGLSKRRRFFATRGYRWDARRRCWTREIAEEVPHEEVERSGASSTGLSSTECATGDAADATFGRALSQSPSIGTGPDIQTGTMADPSERSHHQRARDLWQIGSGAEVARPP